MDEQFRRFKMQIPQSVCELVATGPAHLTTVNPDGSPEVTVVWVGIDDEFVMGHLGMWKRVQRIRGVFDEETRRKPLVFAADAVRYGI